MRPTLSRSERNEPFAGASRLRDGPSRVSDGRMWGRDRPGMDAVAAKYSHPKAPPKIGRRVDHSGTSNLTPAQLAKFVNK